MADYSRMNVRGFQVRKQPPPPKASAKDIESMEQFVEYGDMMPPRGKSPALFDERGALIYDHEEHQRNLEISKTLKNSSMLKE